MAAVAPVAAPEKRIDLACGADRLLPATAAIDEREAPVMLDPEFLKRLACPECKVVLRPEEGKLVCTRCGRRFPVRDGIPVLLLEEAELPAGGTQPAGGRRPERC